MSKIVWAMPPLSSKERYGGLGKGGSRLPPLGLALLAAITRRAGFETDIADAEALGWGHETAATEIVNKKPDYVGITAVTMSVHNAAKLAEEIKKRAPQTTTLIGGVHLSTIPEETMQRFTHLDIGVIGEGDDTIVELLKTLDAKGDIEDVNGLILRKGSQLVRTTPRAPFSSLDTLPFPAWDLLPNLPEYYRPAANCFSRLPSSSLITSRGCPCHCTFCDRTVSGSHLRGFSVPYLMGMINHIYDNYGIRDIMFHDDNFVALRKRLLEFCDTLAQENLDLRWSCTARVDMVTPESLKAMRKAGCWQIAYGIESGSQEILNSLRKRTSLKRIRDSLRWTKENGIETRGYFMIGMPGETSETIQQTIDFLLELELDDFQMSIFAPHPGTEITKDIEKYGEYDSDWRKDGGWHVTFVPNGLTKEEIEHYHKTAFMRFYLRPRVLLRYALKSLNSWSNAYKLLLGATTLFKFGITTLFGSALPEPRIDKTNEAAQHSTSKSTQ